MVNKSNKFDIVIVGGGPAGMQAALVLARTRKRTVVFDDPQPPRNAASHGVHNFLGLDGLLPAEISKIAWDQIDRYGSAELRHERIIDIRHNDNLDFVVTGDQGSKVTAHHVILAFGYHDVYPEIPGFMECWGDTIIPCPFCDGYENRDRTWGIVGSSLEQIHRFPLMAQNWTSDIKLILTIETRLGEAYEAQLEELGIPVHQGTIKEIQNTNGKVESITLDSGEKVEVGTLFWALQRKPSLLVQNLVDNLHVKVDESGFIVANDMQQTNVDRLWAVGDLLGGRFSAIGAANAGGLAAALIVHDWYGKLKSA